jgi:hypothetical protein
MIDSGTKKKKSFLFPGLKLIPSWLLRAGHIKIGGEAGI